MPSSAAIGFLKIDVEHKGTLETEGSSQYFTDQCAHLCWKPLIHCLYQIDHVVVVVQLPPYIQS